ncbi:2'-5' RNA ligase family protein [Streptomyces sp. Caat 7-52]|uniref:2'-5' RNA ligase family protein n=1 Tax=Streptomyces sp. Caat 7-52 TaxID=2949637 RepID=UPI002034FD3E|nr:2'-5' RNA ligase family protein [Streptomyces sp. Caat 7-52]
MGDHWDRPGWTDGKRTYYWMLAFSRATDLLGLAEHCQKALRHLGMDPVPSDGLHVTMLRVGPTDQVSMDQVQQLLALAQDLRSRAFRLLAHPLAGSRGAIRFSLTPWRPVIHLHAALTDAGERVGIPGGRPTSAFRPHLGIAYNNRARPAAPVVDAVEQLRSRPPAVLDLTTVELVELRRQDRAYRWRTAHSVPLRPGVPSQLSIPSR